MYFVASSRKHVLSFTLLLILATVQQSQNCNTLHHTRCGVAQELAAGLQRAIDPNVVLGSHEEVAGLGGMVGRLLRNIVSTCSVRIVPVAGEGLSENGVQGLLDASARMAGEENQYVVTAGSREN
jgi:hypothetical protein